MHKNEDVNRLWVSRVSFGLAAVALTAMIHGGCQRSESLETEGERVPAAKVVPAQPASSTQLGEGTEPAVAKPSDALAIQAEPKVTPKAEAKPDDAPPTPETIPGALEVKRLTVTGEVKDREPVAQSEFTVGEGSVLAFVEMKNDADVEQKIVITFEREGSPTKVGFVELTIPGKQPRWRTWGQTRNIKAPGDWVAVVSSADGTELGRTKFQVSAPVGDG